MAYGQKNYNEIQGINGKYRINQIGCFVTAFANLLDRFGRGVGDPIAMNRILRDNGIYVDVDDGIRDDLAYSSISRVNGNIVVTGQGNGVPPHSNAIVKFTGLSGFGTHFCLVADAAKGLIVDSWDGVVKSWNVYGGPKSWATYEDRTPKPAPAPTPQAPADTIVVQSGWGISHVAKAAGYADFGEPARWDYLARLNGHADHTTFRLVPNQVVKVRGDAPAPAAPQPSPQPAPAPQAPETVNITVQAGWGITHVLKAAGYSKEQWDNEAEWDRVAQLNGSATRLRLKPNQVVKVYRNPLPIAQPAPAPEPAPTPAPVAETPQPVTPVSAPAAEAAANAPVDEDETRIPVTVVPKDPKAYQKTLEKESKVYIAQASQLIHDADGLHMDLQLVKDQKVTSGGTFTKVDDAGKEHRYVITQKHLTDGKWYGIPVELLDAGQNPNTYVGPLTADDDDYLDKLLDEDFIMESKEALKTFTSREKFLDFLGKIYEFILKLNIFSKKDKN